MVKHELIASDGPNGQQAARAFLWRDRARVCLNKTGTNRDIVSGDTAPLAKHTHQRAPPIRLLVAHVVDAFWLNVELQFPCCPIVRDGLYRSSGYGCDLCV